MLYQQFHIHCVSTSLCYIQTKRAALSYNSNYTLYHQALYNHGSWNVISQSNSDFQASHKAKTVPRKLKSQGETKCCISFQEDAFGSAEILIQSPKPQVNNWSEISVVTLCIFLSVLLRCLISSFNAVIFFQDTLKPFLILCEFARHYIYNKNWLNTL